MITKNEIKVISLLAVLLGITMILTSTILLSYNNAIAQTLDTITKQREIFKNNPQIPIGLGPPIGPTSGVGGLEDITVNSKTNKIYVTNRDSNTISVISSNTGNITSNIRVGFSPRHIAVNELTNKIYVTNLDSNTVSIIDGHTDRVINTIPVGEYPYHIAVNELTNKIYVANELDNSVSVIDGHTDRVINTIPVGQWPNYIKVIPYGKVIYVANQRSETISVIDGYTDKVINTIALGQAPFYIAFHNDLSFPKSKSKVYVASVANNIYVIDNDTEQVTKTIRIEGPPEHLAVLQYSENKIYVPVFYNRSIYMIDGATDKVTKTIRIEGPPEHLAVNEDTNKIYVSSPYNNVISVINGSTDRVTNTIPVGPHPSNIAVDPTTNMIYVINSDSNTVSVIDGSTDKVTAGVMFKIHPSNSGSIICNNKDNYPTDIYLYVASGTKCIAKPNKGFEFIGWVENVGRNSTIPLNQSTVSDAPLNSLLSTFGMKPNDPSAYFGVDRFGTFTADFKALPSPIPQEYLIPLYGIVVSSIVGWSIPSIIVWIKSRIQIRIANQYHKRIHFLYTYNSKSYEIDKTLDKLRKDIKNAYAEGKISEQHYNSFQDETSLLYERSYKNRIDSLACKDDIENIRLQLNKIKDDITDAYAEGKISEQHYNLLNEKIVNCNDVG